MESSINKLNDIRPFLSPFLKRYRKGYPSGVKRYRKAYPCGVTYMSELIPCSLFRTAKQQGA